MNDRAARRLADRVTAIVVTYNSAAVLSAALDSIAELDHCLVVDNASHDQSCTLVESGHPRVRLLKNPRNLGFGVANNRAAALADTEFLLLLNPDARLLPGALAALVDAADRYPDAAILAPRLVDETGQPRAILRHPFFRRHKIKGRFDQSWIAGDLCAEMLSGAVMLIRRAWFAGEPLFDPALFLYYEDDDLCLRARARQGALVIVAGALAYHAEDCSSLPCARLSALKQRETIASQLHLIRKYRGGSASLAQAALLLLRNLLNIPFYLLTGKARRARRSLHKVAGTLLFMQRWASGYPSSSRR